MGRLTKHVTIRKMEKGSSTGGRRKRRRSAKPVPKNALLQRVAPSRQEQLAFMRISMLATNVPNASECSFTVQTRIALKSAPVNLPGSGQAKVEAARARATNAIRCTANRSSTIALA